MSLDIAPILSALQSHALSLGAFDSVLGHEAKIPPGTGVHCEIFGSAFEFVPGRSGLAVVSAKFVARVRLRTSWTQKPEDDVDTRLCAALDPLMVSYCGDFTLDGLVESVDLLGAAGTPISGTFGYLDQGGQMFRTIEIQLPLIVDDLWTEEA